MKKLTLIFMFGVFLFGWGQVWSADPCNCKGYDGPGGPCYDGPGGSGENCPSICK